MNRLTWRHSLNRTAASIGVLAALGVAACGSTDTSSPSGDKGTGGSSNGTGGATTGTGTTGSGGATTTTSTTGTGGATTTTTGTTGTGGATTGTTGTGGATTTTGTGGATTTTGTGGTGGATTTTGTGGATTGTGGATGGSGGTGGAGGAGGADAGGGGLTPPAAGTGIQIVTAPFTVKPGEELFRCFHTEIPMDTELDVSEFESVMSAGSHHFILYRADGDTAALGSTTTGSCAGGFSQNWVYSSGTPHYGFKNPAGVAMVLNARQRVAFDMHYLNTTTANIDAKVALNMMFAKAPFQKAGTLISFNTSINIPANGTQTVTGTCTPGAGANFFMASTHTHRRGTLATINRVNTDGSVAEELVHTTDWEKPDLKSYQAAPFLTFKAGEKFKYSCTYQNDRNAPTTVGNSAETNEMCMAVTYFFPATATGTCN